MSSSKSAKKIKDTRRPNLKNAVLDSYAVLAFLFKEKGHEIILDLFEKALKEDQKILLVSPNWAEVRYMIERKAGADQWDEVREKLLGLPLQIIDVDRKMAEAAGEIKVFHKMSLADCFAAALAKQQKAELYTGDPEFKAIEGEQKIVWL
jgi:predicted nucleic acid-binding protein